MNEETEEEYTFVYGKIEDGPCVKNICYAFKVIVLLSAAWSVVSAVADITESTISADIGYIFVTMTGYNYPE